MRLTDYEYYFCTELHSKLKSKVHGKVFTSVSDDVLTVSITNGDIKVDMCIPNLADKILHGYSTEYASYEVLKQYKKEVLKRFIK